MEESKERASEEIKTTAETAKTPHHKISKMPKPRLALGLVILVVGLLLLGYAVAYRKPTPYAKVATSSSAGTSYSSSPTQSSEKTQTNKADESKVSWLDKPVKIADLGLFLDPTPATEIHYDFVYYQVGKDGDKDFIIASYQPEGPAFDTTEILLLGNTTTGYQILESHSPDVFYSADGVGKITYNGPSYTAKVKSVSSIVYPSIEMTETVTVNGATLTKVKFAEDKLFDKYSDTNRYTITPFTDIPEGKLYKIEYKSPATDTVAGLRMQSIVLLRKDGMSAIYNPKPDFLTDDKVAQITWNDGKVNKDSYRNDGYGGCGSFDYVSILDDTNLTGLKATGKTKTGLTVYEFTDSNNPVVQAYYKQTNGEYYAKSGDSYANKKMSIAEYLGYHGLIVVKDQLNREVLFSNLTYGPTVECGKPVVYLYPTAKTQVSVKVGATITKSEPAYETGWNVVAEPSGRLTNQDGKIYDSLFWEGTAGLYPTIQQGTVVKQADVVATITSQLAQLGLNQKETSDFLEFWTDKLPKTPYTRLTWLGTSAMNRLAPLTITPKPDTVIRVFLDFAGLDKSVVLEPQKLTKIPRNGFTVVEWGGLLKK